MLLPYFRDSPLLLLTTRDRSVGRVFQDNVPPLFVAVQEQLYDGAANQVPASTAALPSSLIDNLLSTFDPQNHPATTVLASYLLVTALDMVPFVPCQPLAIALGAKLGFGLAFPICTVGQTTAGVLAFVAARRASNSPSVRDAVAASAGLSPEATARLEEFRRLTAAEGRGDDVKVLSALVGLRLAPFFPFSAGNYLLGGTTRVPLRLFVAATLLGCLLSNFISVSVGAAGGALVFSSNIYW